MTSYLNDHDITESSLPSINGNTRSSRCDLRSSRILDVGEHHHGHGHVHGHHHIHQQVHSDGEGSRHVRFGPSHQLSGSTSNLNREYTVSSSKEYITRPQSPTCKSRKHILEVCFQSIIFAGESGLNTFNSQCYLFLSNHVNLTEISFTLLDGRSSLFINQPTSGRSYVTRSH